MMLRTNEPNLIRDETVSAYSQCPRKAFLLHCTEERGAPKEYERLLEERSRANRTSYRAKLQRTKTAIRSYKIGALSSEVDVLTEADFQAANVEAHCDVLVRADQCKNPHVYEPTIVVGTYRVEEEQALKLAVAGYVLEHIQRTSPAAGYVVTCDGECHRINLQPLFKTVRSILEHIKAWSAEHPAQPPPVILNRHCPYCPFESVCRQQAEATDDLSLLDRMTPKAIRRYHDKGIFTVKQLSFLFKPRRRGRRARIQPPHFNLEIQALAIRTGKIYVETVPEIQRCDTELFLDIEGVPDQQFSYLIGLLIRDHQTITHHTFWADTTEGEESIWTVFVERISERAYISLRKLRGSGDWIPRQAVRRRHDMYRQTTGQSQFAGVRQDLFSHPFQQPKGARQIPWCLLDCAGRFRIAEPGLAVPLGNEPRPDIQATAHFVQCRGLQGAAHPDGGTGATADQRRFRVER